MKVVSSILIFLLVFFGMACDDQKASGDESISSNKSVVSGEPDHPGKLLYMQFCLSCHMYKGEGVPGLYPPLIQTDAIAGDVEKIIGYVLKGQEGPIIVNGENYNNIMTKLDFLTDKEVADVLSYVRSNFGNNYPAVSEEQVKEVRSKLPK